MKLYVGNLPFSMTEGDLSDLFSQVGSVSSARIITDRDTGRSRGFGFVEMGSKAEGQAAIEQLGGKEIDGRALTVNEAKPMAPRAPRSGGYGGGGGGGYGGGNRY